MGRFAGDYTADGVIITVGVPVGPGGAAVVIPDLPAGFGEGIVLSGFGPDTFAAAARAADLFTQTVGADGEVTFNRMLNKAAVLTFTLTQSSLSNAVLSALVLAWEQGIRFVVPVTITDINTSPFTERSAPSCVIQRLPDTEFAAELGTVAWAFLAASEEAFIGGRTF